MKDKLFCIKKYVMAPNAKIAIKREKQVEVDDLWIDDEWRRNNDDKLERVIGFKQTKKHGKEKEAKK